MSHKGQHSHNFKQIEAYSLFAQTNNDDSEPHHKKKSHNHKHKHHKKRSSSTGDLAADANVPQAKAKDPHKELTQSIPGQVVEWKRKQKKKYVYDSSGSSSEEGPR